jgi:hypothetical protein
VSRRFRKERLGVARSAFPSCLIERSSFELIEVKGNRGLSKPPLSCLSGERKDRDRRGVLPSQKKPLLEGLNTSRVFSGEV